MLGNKGERFFLFYWEKHVFLKKKGWKSKKWKRNNLMEFEHYRGLWASHKNVYIWTSKKNICTVKAMQRCQYLTSWVLPLQQKKVKIINFGSKPLGRASRPVKINHAVRTDLKAIASERVVRRDVEGPRVADNSISDTCQLSWNRRNNHQLSRVVVFTYWYFKKKKNIGN